MRSSASGRSICAVAASDRLLNTSVLYGLAKNTFVYFAYGSNMLGRRLRANDRAPSACPIGTGFVSGRRLNFDKIGVDSSGKCNIEVTGNVEDRVYGVLFEVDRADKEALDRVEGLGKGYDDEIVRVVAGDGVLDAVTYVALVKDPDLKPYHWYKAFVISGAVEHGLPGAYVDSLRKVESVADPDDERREAQEAILSGP